MTPPPAGRGWDGGQITAFFAVFAVALLALAGLTVDGGRALATKSKAISTAAEAARAGAQALDLLTYRTTGVPQLDPAQARRLAQDYLTAADAQGVVTATPVLVTVTVTAVTGTHLLTVLGVRQITVTGTASSTPVRGVGASVAGPPGGGP
ncbi:pilus assembly protein TadG-related protein [Frankia sp. CiP3]|uniref:pilus assembly protein TadG-related protein n=1 Tax=Frankia sp. CiP3 TaxID=2880971 RepID=UPI001EF64872|nr:pilus assembly protein TadG-related protein [Frankia sp. CiP3]